MRTTSRVISFIRGMRAAGRFGAASRASEPEVALREYQRVLSLLAHPKVDPEVPLVRTTLVLALNGYCIAAGELGKHSDILEQLTKWRPIYLEWLEPNGEPNEQEQLTYLESVFAWSRRR